MACECESGLIFVVGWTNGISEWKVYNYKYIKLKIYNTV